MYKFYKDKKSLQEIHLTCSRITNELKLKINSEDYINIDIELLGNGNKKLITRNENGPVDLDYNLIIKSFPKEGLDCKETKDYIISKLTKILSKYEYESINDSVPLIEVNFKENYKNELPSFNLNIGIIVLVLNESTRLVHGYNKKLKMDKYSWNKITNIKEVDKKVEILKETGLWEELRSTYLNKKNMYFSRNDLDNHPDFLIYIESVNELFSKLVSASSK